MKKIIICLLFPYLSTAQSRLDSLDNKMNRAGIEMIKFTNTSNIGVGFQAAGFLMCTAGVLSNNAAKSRSAYYNTTKGNGNTIIYVGAGLGVVGTLITIFARDHVSKAGMILREGHIPVYIRKKKKEVAGR